MPSLLWKEWHEQRWKLAFGSLILGAFALIGLRTRIVPDQSVLEWLCFLAVTLVPVLASTGLVAPEREDGTFQTLMSLPVAPGRILGVKIAMGVLLTAGPIMVAMGVSLLVAGGREMTSGTMVLLYVRSVATALALYFWMFALTARLPSETRASLIAMAVVIGWLIVVVGMSHSWETPLYHNPMVVPPVKHETPSIGWTVCPYVFLLAPENFSAWRMVGSALVQVLIVWLLMFWVSRRFAPAASTEGT
jgi:ABC-2 family transporter